MALANNQVLQERYRLVSKLGQGGMGAVYRAWNTRLDVPIAVKEMIPQPGLDQQTLTQLRQQFQREAQILAQLSHPHLVRVTDFFEEGGSAYLVMDFVEGDSLADLIKRQGALPETQVLEWTHQLLDALSYCHIQGIIHRDIKPQNVIIRPDGRAALVDFGLVKLWDPNDPRTQTAMRGMGTPEYAPPEQYDVQGGHTDPRSDIYSLGATMYHAMTGHAPPTATMRIADSSQFRQPRTLAPHITPATEAAILQATELSIKNRFATAQDMAAALGSEISATSLAVFSSGTPGEKTKVMPGARVVTGTQFTPTARHRQLSAWVWILGGAIAIALLGGVALLWQHGPASTSTTDTIATAVAATALKETKTLSPTPSPFPAITPTPTWTTAPEPPTDTPPSVPTDVPGPIIYFEERFSSASPDTQRWQVFENGGRLVPLSPGLRLEQGVAGQYPYLISRVNPFPTSGDFEVEILFRYDNLTTYGTGIAISICCQENAQIGLNPEPTTLLSLWQDTQGMRVVRRNYGIEWEKLFYLGEGNTSLELQQAVIRFSAENAVIVSVNGREITSLVAAQRPDRIWLGNPNVVEPNEWSTLEVISIRVTTR